MIADKSIKTSEQSQAINANVDTPPAPPNGSRDVRHGTIPHPSTPDTSNWPLQSLKECIEQLGSPIEINKHLNCDCSKMSGKMFQLQFQSRYPKDILLKVMDR